MSACQLVSLSACQLVSFSLFHFSFFLFLFSFIICCAFVVLVLVVPVLVLLLLVWTVEVNLLDYDKRIFFIFSVLFFVQSRGAEELCSDSDLERSIP